MRKLIQSACIFRFVVEYKCSQCDGRFPVGLHKHITGGTAGPPFSVKQDFEEHMCHSSSAAATPVRDHSAPGH
jgi:hypothetical protein